MDERHRRYSFYFLKENVVITCTCTRYVSDSRISRDILHAFTHLFVKQIFLSTTTRQIANHAKVYEASILCYFKSLTTKQN
jgi:hypothetical protein